MNDGSLLRAAGHALRSYQYGNATPDLAKEIADKIDEHLSLNPTAGLEFVGSTFSISSDGQSITCHVCGRTSYHLKDVEKKFCGKCNVFHEDRTAGVTPPIPA